VRKRMRRLLAGFMVLMLVSAEVCGIAETLTLPAALQIIDEEAFYGDTSIDKVVLHDEVVSIGSRAFAYSSVAEISIPATVNFIAPDAFEGVEQLIVRTASGSYAYYWAMSNDYIVVVDCAAESISLSEKQLTMMVGDEEILLAEVLPEEAAGNPITWDSSDISVATVENGVVTAQGVGVCNITATTENGLSASCRIVCEKKVDIPKTPEKLQAAVNENGDILVSWEQVADAAGYQITFTKGDDIRSTVVYGVDNTSATIPGTYLTAQSSMSISVSAFNRIGYSQKSAAVTVTRPEKNGVVLTASSESTSVLLTWTNAYGASGYTVLRSESIDGEYIAIAELGEDETTYRDVSGDINITYFYMVRPAVSQAADSNIATGVALKPEVAMKHTSITLNAGESVTLTYTVGETYRPAHSPIWYSDNDDVVHVNPQGVLTAGVPGVATVHLIVHDTEITCRVEVLGSVLRAETQSDSVLLTWAEMTGSGYNILRAETVDGEYEIIDQITSSTRTIYRDDSGEIGKIYYYQIMSRNTEPAYTNVVSAAAEQVSLTPITPENIRMQVNETCEILYESGTSYRLWLNGPWISDNEDIALVDINTGEITAVGEGVTTVFGNVYGRRLEYTVTVTGTAHNPERVPLEAPMLYPIEDVEDGILCTWSQVEGADGYYLYTVAEIDMAQGVEPFILINKGNITSYTLYNNINLMYNQRNTIWVVAFTWDGDESDKSNEYVIRPDNTPDEPVITGISAQGKTINVTWDETFNAAGYRLYWNTKDVKPYERDFVEFGADERSGSFTVPNADTMYYVWISAMGGGCEVIGDYMTVTTGGAAAFSVTVEDAANTDFLEDGFELPDNSPVGYTFTLIVDSEVEWTLTTRFSSSVLDEWLEISPTSGKAGRTEVTVTITDVPPSRYRATATLRFVTADEEVYSESVALENTEVEAPVTYVEDITIAGSDHVVCTGESLQMTATVLPRQADNRTVAWSVKNNTGKATISSNGLLKAISPGQVAVTAASTDGSGISDTITVTIIEEMPDGDVPAVLSVEMSDNEITVGESVFFTIRTANANQIQLVVDGVGYEKYTVTNGVCAFDRVFTSAGERAVSFRPLRGSEAGSASSIYSLTVESNGMLEAPAVSPMADIYLGQGTKVVWSKVNDAEYYVVTVNYNGSEVWRKRIADDLSIPVDASAFPETGEYVITVMACGTGYSQSEGSAVLRVKVPQATFALISPAAGTYTSTEGIQISVSNPDAYPIAVRVMQNNVPVAYFPADGSTTTSTLYTETFMPEDVGSFTLDVLSWMDDVRGADSDAWNPSVKTAITVNGPLIYSVSFENNHHYMTGDLKEWIVKTNNNVETIDLYDGQQLLTSCGYESEYNYQRTFRLIVAEPSHGKHNYRLIGHSADKRTVSVNRTIFAVVPESGTLYPNKTDVFMRCNTPEDILGFSLEPSDSATVLGRCGSWYYVLANEMTGFVHEDDLTSSPLNRWDGLTVSILEMENDRSIYSYQGSSMETRLTLQCNQVLPPSAEVVVTLQPVGGKEYEVYAGAPGLFILSKDFNQEGRYNVYVKVRKVGTSTVYCSSRYVYFEVFRYYGDYLYYAQPDDYQELLKKVIIDHEVLENSHRLFNGGYRDDISNRWIEGIDITELTEDALAKAYADLLGTNALDLGGQYAKYAFMVDQIMKNASYGKKSTIPVSTLKQFFEDIGFGKDMVNNFLYLANLDNEAVKQIPLEKLTTEVYNQWFKQNKNVDLKALSPFEKASDFAKTLQGILDDYAIYANCDRQKVSSIIEGLNQSGDPDLQAVAIMLQMAMDNPLNYLGANCGIKACQKLALTILKKAGNAILDKLSAIPIVGPILMGIRVGISVGTGINKALMNIDGIQKAAYDAEYAINLAQAYYPTYLECYYAFYEDPFSPDIYNEYMAAVATFTELVALEYETYAEISRQIDKAPLGKLDNLISYLSGKNPNAIFNSVENITTHIRMELKNNLNNFYTYIVWPL